MMEKSRLLVRLSFAYQKHPCQSQWACRPGAQHSGTCAFLIFSSFVHFSFQEIVYHRIWYIGLFHFKNYSKGINKLKSRNSKKVIEITFNRCASVYVYSFIYLSVHIFIPVTVMFLTRDKQQRCQLNILKRAWSPCSPSIPQYPATRYSWHTLPSSWTFQLRGWATLLQRFLHR